MDINQYLEILSNGGISALALYFAYRAITKLYEDMQKDKEAFRLDHEKREEKILGYLDKQNDINTRIAIALEKLDGRVCVLEKHFDSSPQQEGGIRQ